jgi:putative ABC transport system substrate-binding protein
VLEAARAMNPRVQKLGIPFNPSQANSRRYMELAHEAATKMGVDILEGSVDNTAAVGEVTDSLVSRGAEAIVVIGDVTVGLGIDSVIASARKGRIPVLDVLPSDVKRGAMYAAGADFYAVGRQMGDMAARLFSGEDPAKMPVSYALPKSYGVNLQILAALKDHWTVPPAILAKASVVVR